MATTRPFAAYNGTVPAGTERIGNLLVGLTEQDYASGPGNTTWYMGPDEDLGHVIGMEIDGEPSFWRSQEKTDASMLDLINYLAPRFGSNTTFKSLYDAKEFMDSEGMFYSGFDSLVESVQSGMIFYRSIETDTWTYIIMDWSNGKIHGPINTGIRANPDLDVPGIDYNNIYLYPNIIHEKGYHFIVRSNNSDEDSLFHFRIVFMDNSGAIIEDIHYTSTDGDSIVTQSYDYKFYSVYLEDTMEFIIFDGATVIRDSETISTIEPDNWDFNPSTDDNTSLNGFIVKFNKLVDGVPSANFYYFCNSDGMNYMGVYLETGNYPSFSTNSISDKILTFIRDWDTDEYKGFRIYNENLETVRNISFDGLEAIYTNVVYQWYGRGRIAIVFYNAGDSDVDYKVIFYDTVSDTLEETSHPKGITYPEIEIDAQYIWVYESNPFNVNDSVCVIITFFKSDSYQGNFIILGEVVNIAKFGSSESITYNPEVNKFGSQFRFHNNNITRPALNVDDDVVIMQFKPNGSIVYSDPICSYADLNDIDGAPYSIVGNKSIYVIEKNEGITILYSLNNTTSAVSIVEVNYAIFSIDWAYGVFIISFNDQETSYYINTANNAWTLTSHYYFRENSSYFFPTSPENRSKIIETSGKSTYKFNDVQINGDPSIEDGGNNLFDGGNIISTNIAEGNDVAYTHTPMFPKNLVNSDDYSQASNTQFIGRMDGSVVAGGLYDFGEEAQYFTNVYPGLFVLSVVNSSINSLWTYGSVGNSNSKIDAYSKQYTNNSNTYTAYFKLRYGGWGTGTNVNRIMIVDNDGTGIIHNYSDGNPSLDGQEIYTDDGESIANKIHLLFFATYGGGVPTETEVDNFVTSYLSYVDNVSIGSLNTVLNSLNNNYSIIVGNLPPFDQNSNGRILSNTTFTSGFNLPEFDDMAIGENGFAIIYANPDRGYKYSVNIYSFNFQKLNQYDTEDYLWFNLYAIKDRYFVQTFNKVYIDPDIYTDFNFGMITPTTSDSKSIRMDFGYYGWETDFNDATWSSD